MSRPSALYLAPVSAASPAPQLQQVDTSTARPSHRRDKKKWAVEFDPANPPTVNPESIVVATRGMAREAQAEQVGLERRTDIVASQPGILEGYMPDPEFTEVVKRSPRYL